MEKVFLDVSLYPLPFTLYPSHASSFAAPWPGFSCSLFPIPYSLFPTPCSLRYNAHMLTRLYATNYRCVVNCEWQKILS
jgi:hypothetical protein